MITKLIGSGEGTWGGEGYRGPSGGGGGEKQQKNEERMGVKVLDSGNEVPPEFPEMETRFGTLPSPKKGWVEEQTSSLEKSQNGGRPLCGGGRSNVTRENVHARGYAE